VKALHYLRHPALAFWLVASLALCALLVAAVYTGNHSSAATIRREPVNQSPVVFTLRTQLSTLTSVSRGDSSALITWSNKTASAAQSASDNYRNSGGGSSDPINVGYLRLATDAHQMSLDVASSSTHVSADELAVLADGDLLVSALPGIGADANSNPGVL
jgi:hypothetical protein